MVAKILDLHYDGGHVSFSYGVNGSGELGGSYCTRDETGVSGALECIARGLVEKGADFESLEIRGDEEISAEEMTEFYEVGAMSAMATG